MMDEQPSHKGRSARRARSYPCRAEQRVARPPAALAAGFLAVNYNLHFARLAAQGAINQFVTTIDGPATEIGADNATTYVDAFAERLATYTRAIETRGFQQLDTAFDFEASDSPGEAGPALLQQDRFLVSLWLGGKKFSGVIVESALVMEDAENPEYKMAGDVADGHISLNVFDSGYSVATLTLQPRADLDANFAAALAVRAFIWCKEEEYAKALEDVHEALRIDKDCDMALLVQAQILATASEARFRDGPMAVQAATQACELAGWQDWA